MIRYIAVTRNIHSISFSNDRFTNGKNTHTHTQKIYIKKNLHILESFILYLFIFFPFDFQLYKTYIAKIFDRANGNSSNYFLKRNRNYKCNKLLPLRAYKSYKKKNVIIE